MADGYQDKRVERSKRLVLEETYRQLTQGGLSGVSIDEISKESGVAKTTIYRHWPTRSSLLMDACSRLGGTPSSPNRGSLEADLMTLVGGLGRELDTAPWTGVLPSILDAAERDPEVDAMQQTTHKGHMSPFYAAVEAAKQRGEIEDDVNAEDVISMTVGPLFYRRWFSKSAIDDAFVKTVVDAAIRSAGGAQTS